MIFKTNGLGNGDVIAMDGNDLSQIEDYQIDTWSEFYTARKLNSSDVNTKSVPGNDIIIHAGEWDEIFYKPDDIDDDTNEDYGPIWDSIVNGNQDYVLGPSIDDLGSTVSIIDQIYANNPYIQSSKLSKENLDVTRDVVLNTKMPNYKEWIVEGHGIYSNNKSDVRRNEVFQSIRQTEAGNPDPYVYLNNKYTTNLYTSGLIGTGEYGIAEKTSVGFAVGGSHQKASMSINSKLEGKAIYLGAYAKKKVNNFTFLAGTAYQYGDYDGTRTIANQYQSIENKGKIKVDSFDIYTEGKYTFEDSKGRKIEPKVRVTESFIGQKSVSEKNRGYDSIAIDMDKKNYAIPEVEIGVEFIEPIKVSSGKLEAKVGIALAKTFGDKDSYQTARVKDSTDFKVMGAGFREKKLKIGTGLDYEKPNGMMYNVSLGLNVIKNEAKNTDTRRDYNVTVGVGYRF